MASDTPTLAEQYNAAIGLMQDTGQTVWLINSAYLIVETAILGAVGSLLLGEHWGLLIVTALFGFLLFVFWLASFQRSYGFYNFRVHYVRSLEADGPFSLLTEGIPFSEGDPVEAIRGQSLGVDEAGKPKKLRIGWPGRLRRGWGNERWTENLIISFGAAFFLIAVVGAVRCLTAKPVPPPAPEVRSAYPTPKGDALNVVDSEGNVYRVPTGGTGAIKYVGNVFQARSK